MLSSALYMAWIDYKATFDMIPHSWLAECLEIYSAEESIIRFLKNTMPNWKTILTSSGTRLAEVNIRRGIIQGGSLSPLLLLVEMIPMTRVLERIEVWYQLEKGGSRINHQMFMDDIKLFGRGTTEIDTLAFLLCTSFYNLSVGEVWWLSLPDSCTAFHC